MEYYVFVLCKNLIKKLQKYVLSLSHMRHLAKKVKKDQTNFDSMRINSYRKKVLKDINYQVKEYLHKNLSYLIERLDRFYNEVEDKQKKY
jgi:hypothetical protein